MPSNKVRTKSEMRKYIADRIRNAEPHVTLDMIVDAIWPIYFQKREEMSTMQNIKVGRYAEAYTDPKPVEVDNGVGSYAGWVEPSDRSWILFVRADHSVEMYLDRDPETGVVL